MTSLDQEQPQDEQHEDDDGAELFSGFLSSEEIEKDVDHEIQNDQAIDDLHSFLYMNLSRMDEPSRTLIAQTRTNRAGTRQYLRILMKFFSPTT